MKKKLLIFGPIVLLLLLLGAAAALYFLKLGPFAEKEKPDKPTAEELAEKGKPPRDPKSAKVGPVMVPIFTPDGTGGRIAFNIELIVYTGGQRSEALAHWPHMQDVFLETLYGIEGPIDSKDDLNLHRLEGELLRHARTVLGAKAVYDVKLKVKIASQQNN